MSDIDFQNGFLCGMATKGMLRTGQQYEPKVWNDEGVYDYFYIDFKRSVLPFSTGMFGESVVVHDSEQLPVTNVEYVSPGVYKIYCNIAGKVGGVTCMNKKTTWLKFADGRKVPPFAVHFYVAGLASYMRLDYTYEVSAFSNSASSAAGNIIDLALYSFQAEAQVNETVAGTTTIDTVTGNYTIALV